MIRFLFDEHISLKVVRALSDRGVDAIHVVDMGLRSCGDAEIVDASIREDRIIVTRDYGDFGSLAIALLESGQDFPGMLFISPTIPQGDVKSLVRAIESWIRQFEDGRLPERNRIHWLSLAESDSGHERFVREANELYLSALRRVSPAVM